MLKLKTWKLWLFSGACFLFVGIMYLIAKRNSLGILFICLSVTYFALSKTNYKVDNKISEIGTQPTVSEDIQSELKNLIAEGKKIEAMKKYRMATGVGLKEAKEYIDNMK